MSPVTLVSNVDVGRLLPMSEAIRCIEGAFFEQGLGTAVNCSRSRAVTAEAILAVTGPSALTAAGLMGVKIFSVAPPPYHMAGRTVSAVALYDSRTGALVAVLEADELSRIRTAAATAVATKILSRANSRTLGIVGTSLLARAQIRAVAEVRRIEHIRIFGRDSARRDQAAAAIREEFPSARVESCRTIEATVAECDIVVTSTTAADPIIQADWMKAGVHINAIGANYANRREIPVELVERADLIVVDEIAQAMLEAGDVIAAVAEHKAKWSEVVELGQIVAGKLPGRTDPADVTLFESQGIGILDVAAAGAVVRRMGIDAGHATHAIEVAESAI